MLPLLKEMSLTVAAVRDDSIVAGAVILDEFAFDDSFPHGSIYTITDSLAQDRGLFPMTFVGLDYDARGLLWAVAEGGDVLILDETGVTEDGIDDLRAPLRDLLAIDGAVLVCGGNHQVYRRRNTEDWEDIGPDADLQEDYPENHFEAIAGFSASELYAAGRDGVIWWYDGAVWTPVQATTNLAFLCVTCADDGVVYLGGQAGVVAHGRRDSFEVVTPPEPLADIWGIAEYAGHVRVAMHRALMIFDRDEGLAVDPDAMELAETFYNLARGPDSLWSLGEKDVLRLRGDTWEAFDEVPVQSE